MPIENQWLLLPFAIGKIGTTIWKVSQAVGTDQQKGCRAVLGDRGEPMCVAQGAPWVTTRCSAKVEPIGPYVFLWAGLDQGCLRNHSGAARDLKIEGKQAILRFYGFQGGGGEEGEG